MLRLCAHESLTSRFLVLLIAGNVLFRMLVQEHRQLYIGASKSQKPAITAHVVRLWKDRTPRGRFLVMTDPSKGDESPWEEICERRALKKTGQALREKVEVSHYDWQGTMAGSVDSSSSRCNSSNKRKLRPTPKTTQSTNMNPCVMVMEGMSAATSLSAGQTTNGILPPPPLGQPSYYSNYFMSAPHSQILAQMQSQSQLHHAPSPSPPPPLVQAQILAQLQSLVPLPPTVGSNGSIGQATYPFLSAAQPQPVPSPSTTSNLKSVGDSGVAICAPSRTSLAPPLAARVEAPPPSPIASPHCSFKDEYDRWLVETGGQATTEDPEAAADISDSDDGKIAAKLKGAKKRRFAESVARSSSSSSVDDLGWRMLE